MHGGELHRNHAFMSVVSQTKVEETTHTSQRSEVGGILPHSVNEQNNPVNRPKTTLLCISCSLDLPDSLLRKDVLVSFSPKTWWLGNLVFPDLISFSLWNIITICDCYVNSVWSQHRLQGILLLQEQDNLVQEKGILILKLPCICVKAILNQKNTVFCWLSCEYDATNRAAKNGPSDKGDAQDASLWQTSALRRLQDIRKTSLSFL